jgi:putative copper export protein
MSDSILFSVVGGEEVSQVDPPAPQTPAAWTFDAGSPAYIGVRWALFVGLLGVVGAMSFRFLVLPRTGWDSTAERAALRTGAEHSAASFGVATATLVVVAAILRLYAQSYSLFGPDESLTPDSLRALLDTNWGRAWWIQLAAAVTAFAGFLIAHRKAAAGWSLAAMGVLVLAFTPALSGHALTAPGPPSLGILADGVHVLSAGGWLGSLLTVVVVGIPAAMKLEAPERAPSVAALVNAFSPVALAFAGLLLGLKKECVGSDCQDMRKKN